MLRRERAVLGALVIATLGWPPPILADDVLDGLATPEQPARVNLLGWVEAAGDGAELVISLMPVGKAKLVADPGVIATPVTRAGIRWTGAVPLHHARAGSDYFSPPVVLRLPFTGGDGRPVEADVEYAYCIVDRQCLFGEAKVSAISSP